VRLWIDTDVGTNPDDAIALLVAVAHPRIELVGVSTVGVDSSWRAEVAEQLLAGAGAANVTITPGLPAPALADARPDALLAIGPLTNLARALPAVAPPPPRLTIMGGALRPVRHRGAVREVESNFAADPPAAAAVLAVPGATLLPLDVTAATRLDGDEVEALAAAAPALAPMLDTWAAENPVVLHDAAALLVAAGESVARLEPRRLTVADDGRVREDPGGTEHNLVVELDVAAVRAAVFGYLA
jgi:inosine-uridine nucleoside N-ribohydrolase